MWECRKCFGIGRTAKRVLSACLVLQLLFVLAVVACPALHHALHPDSNRPDHHCLATTFAKGQLSGPETMPVVALPVVLVLYAVLLSSAPPRLSFEYRFAASRAPPRF
jgi:hypothetical protein